MAVLPRASRRTRVISLVLLPILLLGGACRSAKSGSSGLPASPAGGTVVTHALDVKSDTVHDRFRTAPPPTGPIPSGTLVNGKLTSQKFNGTPAVGAIYFGTGSVASLHYCTGSVVHSPSGNLIATAAHCVYNRIFGGYQDHILFVPAYSDGTAPFGTWIATTAYLDHRWVESEDPDADVAFLAVEKAGGGSATLESQIKSYRFETEPGYSLDVSVVGYPMLGDQPVGCAGRTSKFSDTQLRFDCAGFPEGSSGSPFITKDGKLVGVLGGYQQGGDSADTSYSTYLGDSISAVYKTATGSS